MSHIKNKWIIIYERYSGLEAKAIDRLSGALSAQLGYAIAAFEADTVDEQLLAENPVLMVGTPTHRYLAEHLASGLLEAPEGEQGYSFKICRDVYGEGLDTVLICGADAAGVLYGSVDFYNIYMGTEMLHRTYAERTQDHYYTAPFTRHIPPYARKSTPKVARRAIWTWGHCIYDYRRFFENMLILKLNHVVIWNDYVPLNAHDVVEYAHSLGISVYWGFSWGWDTNFRNFEEGESIASETLIDRWAEKVFTQYTFDYLPTGADGIYFQSFTETNKDNLGGISIAEAVVKWVNRIAGRLFVQYPDLDIEFGLHASSVREHLSDIALVDDRIHIVWEDCGAFPYHYSPEALDGFQQTVEFNKNICTLRGEKERFGAVLKGMTKLDWSKFEHQTGRFVMGEFPAKYTHERAEYKRKVWSNLQSYWLENGEYARSMISDIARLTEGQCRVEMLVEDGCLEEGLYFPVVLCSELLWNAEEPISAVIGRVSRNPLTKFATN